MTKAINFAIALIILLAADYSYAQNKNYNALYQPIPLCKRLSYENFRNIKLLYASIINYGGGEAEFENLVEQYSEASALYFQGKYEESAAKFYDNQKEIMKLSVKLAGRYKDDTDKILAETRKIVLKNSVKRSLLGKQSNESAETILKQAENSNLRGYEIYDSYKSSIDTPKEIINSIYYFRRAKENAFQVYSALELDADKAKDKAQKNDILKKYKRDMDDNRNKVFVSKEKQN